MVAWLRSSAARTRLRAVCVGRSRLPLVSLSPIHAADSVGHTADVRNRTCAFFCCPENPEHLARDYRPFIRKPAIFLGSCARRVPLLTRFPACSQPDRTAQSVPYPAAVIAGGRLGRALLGHCNHLADRVVWTGYPFLLKSARRTVTALSGPSES